MGKAIFYGINPLVMAIILAATYRLGKTALNSKLQVILGLLAFGAALLGVNEVVILLGAGMAGILLYAAPTWLRKGTPVAFVIPLIPLLHESTRALTWLDERVVQLGLFFLKVGSLLFGSGMVLFAFIQNDVVNRYGWLTQQQLIDAIAVGQMTPGPVLSSATFIGYLVSGWAGAVVATIAVFLPSFIIVMLMGPIIPRLRRSATAQGFLKGVNAAVVALILFVSLAMFRSAIVDGLDDRTAGCGTDRAAALQGGYILAGAGRRGGGIGSLEVDTINMSNGSRATRGGAEDTDNETWNKCPYCGYDLSWVQGRN